MIRPHGRVLKKVPAVAARALVLLVLLAILTGICSPSYTRLPQQYKELRRTALASATPGRANLGNQRVFIAASLYDPHGTLLSGAWGRSVLELIDLLGPNNTFLSIYSSDSGLEGASALIRYESRLTCQNRLLFHEHVPLKHPAIVTLADGELAIKRIEHLATARNIALEPLESGTRYDKILFLNDVHFDPIEAAQLLFLTNSQHGKSRYTAACGVDFDNPWKFYDTFATRDLEGYSMGVPLFPWFSSSGRAQSRSDVWRQVDAVRVKSCWGGLAAFDAKYFQNTVFSNSSLDQPVRFRSEQELEWDSSECCLVHADLDAAATREGTPTEIFMNPFVRTAYDATTFRWLWVGRRTEKLLGPIQSLISIGLPRYNAHRTTKAGDMFRRTLWVQNSTTQPGFWTSEQSTANPGMFCRIAGSMVRRVEQKRSYKLGQKSWARLSYAADFARCQVNYE